MSRSNWMRVAPIAVALMAVGCAHCDTCGDFPVPCANCDPSGSYTPAIPEMTGNPAILPGSIISNPAPITGSDNVPLPPDSGSPFGQGARPNGTPSEPRPTPPNPDAPTGATRLTAPTNG